MSETENEMRDDLPEDCRELWDALDGIDGDDAGIPTDRMRARFRAALAREKARAAGSAHSASRGPRTVRAAAVLALAAALAVGFVSGRYLLPAGAPAGPAAAPAGADVATADTAAQLEALRGEMRSMSRAVAISLLRHPSAGERIRGVRYSSGAPTDGGIVGALLETVREDPNVNVRLAALSALAERLDAPGVTGALADALAGQDSPHVQLGIAELLIAAGDAAALRRAAATDDLEPSVRERLAAATGDAT